MTVDATLPGAYPPGQETLCSRVGRILDGVADVIKQSVQPLSVTGTEGKTNVTAVYQMALYRTDTQVSITSDPKGRVLAIEYTGKSDDRPFCKADPATGAIEFYSGLQYLPWLANVWLTVPAGNSRTGEVQVLALPHLSPMHSHDLLLLVYSPGPDSTDGSFHYGGTHVLTGPGYGGTRRLTSEEAERLYPADTLPQIDPLKLIPAALNPYIALGLRTRDATVRPLPRPKGRGFGQRPAYLTLVS